MPDAAALGIVLVLLLWGLWGVGVVGGPQVLERMWRACKELVHGVLVALHLERRPAVEAPEYVDPAVALGPCSCRQPTDIEAIRVRDTPTGEPEIARWVCTHCWREANPKQLRIQAAKAELHEQASAIQDTWDYDSMRGSLILHQDDHDRYNKVVAEAVKVGGVRLCNAPDFPTEELHNHQGTEPHKVVTGPCCNCGLTQYEHGEVVPIHDPDTGEHLGDVQRGPDGKARSVVHER